jgi:hypothetical protein
VTAPRLTEAERAETSALGEFFVLDFITAGPRYRDGANPAGWQPLSDLALPSDGFHRRTEQVRAALAAMTGADPDQIERRVAASVAHLGISARIISPFLGLAVLYHRLLPVGIDTLHWQPDVRGAFPLGLAPTPAPGIEVGGGPIGGGPGSAVSVDFAHWLGAGPVATITEAAQTLGVSSQIGWGNVASAMHAGAAAIGRARPELTSRSLEFATAVLAEPPLHGRHFTDVDGQFRRRNCCLIYRLAADSAAVCGDCILGRRGRI